MAEYKKRIADQMLADKLEASGACEIEILSPFLSVLSEWRRFFLSVLSKITETIYILAVIIDIL